MTRAAAARAAAESSARGLTEDPEAVRQELRRITESAVFHSSKRSQEFLDYTVTQALDGHAGELKERLIGSALFGRPADYDTGADSIVRVVANETRRRLQQYYQEEGSASVTRIALPSGTYVPLIHRVETPQTVLVVEAVETRMALPPLATPALAVSPFHLHESNRLLVSTMAAAILALAIACGVLLVERRGLVSQLAAPDVQPWSALFQGRRGVHIILADTSVGGVQNFLRNRLPLSDYINGRYIPNEASLPPDKLSFYRYLMSNQYTSMSYAITGIRIAELAKTYSVPVTVSYAREMSLRTFKGGENFVVLGTARANPWAQLFEPQLNFVLEFADVPREPWFLNRSPRAGERQVYARTDAPGDTLSESYGHIAFLPALYQGGHVLFVTGTNSQATEAAGEFVTDTGRLKSELAKAGLAPGTRQFEVLLRVRHTAGAPVRSEIVAVR